MAAGSTYTPIATVSPSGTTTVDFTSIPSTYTDLLLVVSGANATGVYLSITFNSDTGSNYSRTQLSGNGSTASSTRASNSTSIRTLNLPSGTSEYAVETFNIMNYSNTTTYKTLLHRGGQASAQAYAQVALWRSTAAINSIRLLASSNISTGSTLTLYGIQAA